ncbi:bifunctional diguanylate cyclase/phosphodiesterase [Actinoplanes sp. NPDC023801]|uniref:putative bifunctional diguanylate cyclase/phosphodiesterase n=1 Tax=Actinoplanes sp. NPDC023801 TaxID=3154595 RepID=UPI0034079D73
MMRRGRDGLRRTRRWVISSFIVSLALLSGFSLVDDRRHAAIVEDLVRDAERVAAYQQAAYLSAYEMSLIQAAADDPAGAARQRVLTVDDETYRATLAIAAVAEDRADVTEAGTIARRQVNLRQVIIWYLSLLDRGETAKARDTLETVIAPTYRRNTDRLLRLRDRSQQSYARHQETARQDSHRLVWGGGVTFALSLLVVGLFGWHTRAHRRQVEALAATDMLTGLPNRAAFTNGLQKALAATRPDPFNPGITVLTVNIDGFRHVNDQLGPHVGDRLLAEAGWRLSEAVRDSDLVARTGGDEFAILLRDLDPARTDVVAARLREAFDQSFQLDDITVDLEISIGAAAAAPDDDVTTLLGHADSAMHDAKQQHGSFRRFSGGSGQDSADRLTLLGDLRRGLTDDSQFTLHYQPKVSLIDGSLSGVEALARWYHPTRGPVPPGQFVPVLETTSLIHPFTERVLTIALQQARTWLDAGHRVPVAVNVSTRSLLEESFPGRVAALLASTGVPGELLCIEITEHTVLSDPTTTIEALRQVRELGVKTSIDDFGTGYSSLTYLKLLPVDELKIDRSFVADMVADSSSHALVASAVDLAHNLGLTVVAEGVEDVPTAVALSGLGCDTAQGYHFARPVPAADLDLGGCTPPLSQLR